MESIAIRKRLNKVTTKMAQGHHAIRVGNGDGSWVTMPVLDYAVQELKRVPHSSDILDDFIGPLAPGTSQLSWQKVMGLLDNGGTSCELCEAGIYFLAELSESYSWEELRDSVFKACNALLSAYNSDLDVDQLCVGATDLQGPHVYNVIASLKVGKDDPKPNVRSCCENLNMCFPPKKEGAATLVQSEVFHDQLTKEQETAKQLRGTKLRDKLREGSIRKQVVAQEHSAENIMTIVQITDFHVDPLYAEGAPSDCKLLVCCREQYEGKGSANPYGDYNCNTPERTMNLFLEQIAELKPDFIIYSGDTPPQSPWDESFQSQLRCSEALVESLNRTLSNYDIYNSVGNHDMYPTNLYYAPLPESLDMTERLVKLWTPLSKFEEEQIETMKRAGYYSMLVRPGLRIISYNTLYWYAMNWYTTLNEVEQDGEDMYNYLEGEFQKARQNNEKVIIVAHHPPGNGDIIVSHSRRLVDVVVEYSDVIVLHVSGHTHTDEYRLVADANGVAKEVVFVAPSLTPRKRLNPSARIYELDRRSYQLLNYKQYHLDLEAVIGGAPPEIQLTYNAMDLYGLDDMSPASWLDLAHRFKEDDDLFQQYHQNFYSQTGRAQCNDSCKKSHICNILNPNFDDYSECLT